MWGRMSESSLFTSIACLDCTDVFGREGETVRVKAHGGVIDIEGIVVARVNEKLQLQKIDVWFDPMDMFRQIAKEENGLKTDNVATAAGACPVMGGKTDE
jgi:creatinine amidohydrolase/Fe(II)-dependent formamide hydrolase-like protein